MSKKYPYIEPMLDNRGNEIVVGAKVAYNYSGQIAVGEVISAKPTIWTSPDKARWSKIEIKLGCNMNTDGVVKKPGKLSIVKNPQNVLVLFGDE